MPFKLPWPKKGKRLAVKPEEQDGEQTESKKLSLKRLIFGEDKPDLSELQEKASRG